MKHGSLFSGIGGFDLAAQWMGWENVFNCEYTPFGQRVLNYYWPDAISYTDVTETDFTGHAGQIDILSGGFPCQPYSTAGKRKGKDDDRHLWPQMLRAIREISPRYVVGENVRGLLSWNGGLVFDEVQTDLEAEGYDVLPFLLPAASINAPHERYRIWFIAYSNDFLHKGGLDTRRNSETATGSEGTNEQQTRGKNGQRFRVESCSGSKAYANTSSTRWEEQHTSTVAEGEKYCAGPRNANMPDWQNFPTQPPVCGGDDGLPSELDGITVSKHRRESIKAYGNAIVPQVAYQIFKAIAETEL